VRARRLGDPSLQRPGKPDAGVTARLRQLLRRRGPRAAPAPGRSRQGRPSLKASQGWSQGFSASSFHCWGRAAQQPRRRCCSRTAGSSGPAIRAPGGRSSEEGLGITGSNEGLDFRTLGRFRLLNRGGVDQTDAGVAEVALCFAGGQAGRQRPWASRQSKCHADPTGLLGFAFSG